MSSSDALRRIPNGYGVRTSLYSVSNIGISRGDEIARAKARAKQLEPPGTISTETQLELAKLFHNPSRKGFMQSSYPETIKRLQPVSIAPRSEVERKKSARGFLAEEYTAERRRRLVAECQEAERRFNANKLKSTQCQISF